MKLFTLLVLLLFPLLTYSLKPTAKKALYDHMVEVNANWKSQNSKLFNEFVSFKTDVDRIQMHLLLIEKNLRSSTPSHLNFTQKTNRLEMLDVLRSYARLKDFPINTGHAVRQPYFIDHFGTHCAVGFLVKESGFGWISKAISETQNFAYVKEINSPDLVEWADDFGFTLEELAWIQPGYFPLQSYSQIGDGANGKVTESVAWGSTWYFSGEFDTLDNLPCYKIGKYENGQLSCLGNGLNGEINHLTILNGVQATGHFLDSGVYYPMATFQNNVWSFHSVPNRPNARATAFGASNSQYYIIAIDHPTLPNEQEIWRHSNGNWEQIAKVHGVVNDISGQDGSFVGKFDSVEVHFNGVWSTVVSKNVLIRQNSGEYEGTIGVVPDTVYTISQNWYVHYIGGYATTDSTSSGTIVSSVFNGVAQPLLTANTLYPSNSFAVYEINVFDDAIFISGAFRPSLFFYESQNIARLHPATGTIESLGYFDKPVYTFALVGNSFMVGGDFSACYSGGTTGFQIDDVNRLAQLNGFLSLSEESITEENILLSPNPSKGKLSVTGIEKTDFESIELIDLQGKTVLESKEIKIDGSSLQSGMYLVQIHLNSGRTIQKKWMKE